MLIKAVGGVTMTINNNYRGDSLNKIWLNRYPADVPADINPDRYLSLVEMFEHAANRYANRPAFVNMGEVMTFRQLEERSRAFAAWLQHGLGLQKRGPRRADDAESAAIPRGAIWYFTRRVGRGER